MRGLYHPEMETMAEFESARLAKLEERTKASIRRIDRLEKLCDEVHEQNASLARLAVQLETMLERLEKQEKRLEEIEKIPEKRYTTVIGAVITSLVSAFIGGAITVIF